MANTTWNPADRVNTTLSGGNLIATVSAAIGGVRSIASLSAGKYYWESIWTTISSNTITSGVALATANLSSPATGWARVQRISGHININNIDSGVSISGGSAVAQNSVICSAVDLTAQLIWFRIGAAGQWNAGGAANPATGVGGLSIASLVGALFAAMSGQSDVVTANFGDSVFSGAVPSGFTAGFPVASLAGAQARVMVLA